ncbi:hypothetical protein GGR00_001293 [Aminobacter aganoensis]|uniref:Uncharacterized protein n=1 Tax=Aminobacter aganoensis TaxID=83264 RepID=A0A7X0F5N8_9HYPH|nr:hypothetical protein [Aminobacter aganoensis]
MIARIINNLEPFELVGLAIMFALVVDAIEGWI